VTSAGVGRDRIDLTTDCRVGETDLDRADVPLDMKLSLGRRLLALVMGSIIVIGACQPDTDGAADTAPPAPPSPGVYDY